MLLTFATDFGGLLVPDNWFYADNGRQVGPVTFADLKAALAKLPRSNDVLVWCEEFADWTKAGDVPDLKVVSPPPLPPKQTPQPVDQIKRNKLLALFSFRGRINRGTYWAELVAGMFITGLASIGTYAIVSKVIGSDDAGVWAGLILLLPFYVFVVAISARRLHDFGCSGWWLLLWPVYFFVGGATGAFIWVVYLRQHYSDSIATVLIVASFCLIGGIPGNKETNRFGPTPMSASSKRGSAAR